MASTTGVVFRTFARKPRELPLVQADPEARTEAIAESAAVVSAMPKPTWPAGTTSRSVPRTRSRSCCATGAPCCGGADQSG